MAAVFAFLPESAFEILAIAFLWFCRIGVFIVIFIEWVLEPKTVIANRP